MCRGAPSDDLARYRYGLPGLVGGSFREELQILLAGRHGVNDQLVTAVENQHDELEQNPLGIETKDETACRTRAELPSSR